MTGNSPQIKELRSFIQKMAKSNSNVLITGESGTGKEMVAVAIHNNSARKLKPFVAVNCAAISPQLLESELFGHKKGAFTGAQEARRGLFAEANGGTVFLDEIGDMHIELQSKILRVIQEREVTPVGENRPKPIDVRIITATHKDLSLLVSEGKFRQDLFYRISVVPIRLPSLRDRKDDIPILAKFFLQKYCEKNGGGNKQFTLSALEKLIEQNWPGNVRELENCVERAVELSDDQFIDDDEIQDAQLLESHTQNVEIFTQLMTLEELEKSYILYVLAHTGDQKDKAAKILGINRKTLYRREVEYGLVAPLDEYQNLIS
jgi:two-component system response regulator HydG